VAGHVLIGSVLRGTYNGAFGVAAAGAWCAAHVPLLPGGWRRFGDRRGTLDEAQALAMQSAPVLWMHAASVGELHAVRPLLARLRLRYPERLQLVTTMTRTGLAVAETIPSVKVALLLPLDAPAVMRAFLSRFRLDAFLFTETEIWPNLLAELAAHEVPAIMVSGRSRRRGVLARQVLRALYRPVLDAVTCCMQSEADARSVIALGADPGRVVVTGSLKFEDVTHDEPDSVARLRAVLGDGRPCIVAGSTHAGEESVLLDAFAALERAGDAPVLVLAPRHPERLPSVEAELVQRGVTWERFSVLTADAAPAHRTGALVVLLDVMGPLAACYGVGTVAFVGGTLVPVGGHNLLEPARLGRPIIVGRHTGNVSELLARLVTAGAAIQVSSPSALPAALMQLVRDPERAQAMGEQGRMAAAEGHGALERHMKVIAARLGAVTRTRGEFE
jgi:3-deoxy-D-manno-octulosonic-acid transferase